MNAWLQRLAARAAGTARIVRAPAGGAAPWTQGDGAVSVDADPLEAGLEAPRSAADAPAPTARPPVLAPPAPRTDGRPAAAPASLRVPPPGGTPPEATPRGAPARAIPREQHRDRVYDAPLASGHATEAAPATGEPGAAPPAVQTPTPDPVGLDRQQTRTAGSRRGPDSRPRPADAISAIPSPPLVQGGLPGRAEAPPDAPAAPRGSPAPPSESAPVALQTPRRVSAVSSLQSAEEALPAQSSVQTVDLASPSPAAHPLSSARPPERSAAVHAVQAPTAPATPTTIEITIGRIELRAAPAPTAPAPAPARGPTLTIAEYLRGRGGT